jgi:hypothetical protein
MGAPQSSGARPSCPRLANQRPAFATSRASAENVVALVKIRRQAGPSRFLQFFPLRWNFSSNIPHNIPPAHIAIVFSSRRIVFYGVLSICFAFGASSLVFFLCSTFATAPAACLCLWALLAVANSLQTTAANSFLNSPLRPASTGTFGSASFCPPPHFRGGISDR